MRRMKTIQISSLDQTDLVAKKLAEQLCSQQALILLKGDLGAGKTTFTKALGKYLGVKKVINSPTFTILKSYRMEDGRMLHHMDAYRMEGISQDLGFEEIFEEDAICVVEWPDFIEADLPQERLSITLLYTGEKTREMIINAVGTKYEQLVEEL